MTPDPEPGDTVPTDPPPFYPRKRVPREHVELMTRLRERRPPLTLEEIRVKVLELTGVNYSINAIGRNVRRAGERMHHVYLTPEEELALKEAYGTVGAGLKNATKAVAVGVRMPKDERTRAAYEALQRAVQEAGEITFQRATSLLASELSVEFPEACRLLGQIQKEGFLRRKDAQTLVVLKARELELTPEMAVAQVLGGR